MTKGERTRQLIIERSAPLFNKKGLSGTSLSDILEVTGLAKGSLYVHFENKDAIANAVIDHYKDLKSLLLDQVVRKSKCAKDSLLAYLDIFVNPLTSPFSGGCPFLNFGMEVDDTHEQIRQKIKFAIELEQQRIAEVIERGINNSEFNSNWNPKEFAIKLYAMMEGTIMMSRVTGNRSYIASAAKLLKAEIMQNLL